ncbi:MAG TPA: tetratricopeptide repeat protein [Candidatus Omnitrophota bacterium]|nr:tetratricopeptide repeat protein [Candidatus Omnitrophota bacterium]HPD84714.1 tetratricopeptide repeat protein [Candidatus Omnitrophota bacterium]HRZ03572.1 tetratricopeptide repeat protein [Candidatus Omnitrophota bacterium]
MKRMIYVLMAVVWLAGCGSRQPAEKTDTASAPQAPAVKTDLVEIGAKYLAKGDVVNAMGAFNQAVVINPNDVRAYFVLGQMYMQMANYDKAIENFKSVASIDPNNGQAYLMLGGCYDLQGKRPEAIDAVKKSVEVFEKQRDETGFKTSLAILQKLMQTAPGDPAPKP